MAPDNQSPNLFGQTPWQTVGPFFHYGLALPAHDHLARVLDGEAIEIAGRVFDGEGHPVPDALVEIWQADGGGAYGPRGFTRCATDEDGAWRFRTVRPGAVDNCQAPHIAVGVLGRGLIKRLVTRLYFEGDTALEDDPALRLVPPERRSTLIARCEDGAWRLDIVLRGERETVFFEV